MATHNDTICKITFSQEMPLQNMAPPPWWPRPYIVGLGIKL